MAVADRLALLGGDAVVSRPLPHAARDLPRPEQVEAVVDYLKARLPVSFDTRGGPIAELEDAFAAYMGGGHALTFCSGTMALYGALRALGIRAGDEVLAPAYTFMATATPVLHIGAKLTLVDVSLPHAVLDETLLDRAATSRTRAVIVNHQWGHPANLAPIVEFCRRTGVCLVEDCSHAHGASYQGSRVGTFGDVACFSLQGSKMLSGGEGGILFTQRRDVYERALLLGHYRGRVAEEVHDPCGRRFAETGWGLKLRMHPLAAVLALADLRTLDPRIAMKHAALEGLSAQLAGIPGVEPPTTDSGCFRGAFFGYKPLLSVGAVRLAARDLVVRALRAEGVDARVPGSRPLHLLPLFRDGAPDACIPASRYFGPVPSRAEEYWSRIVGLPAFQDCDTPLFEAYGRAFRKVLRSLPELAAWAKGTAS